MIGVYAIVKATGYGWLSAHTLGFGGLSLALLGAFVLLESRLENPIFPLQILRVPGLAASSAVRGLLMTGMFSTFFLGVLYLEHVHGYGAMKTGLAFLPLTLALAVMSLGVTARVMARFGPARVLVGGLTAIAAALLLLARAGEHASYFPGVAGPFTLLGVGAGLAFLPLMTLAMANVPSRDAGLASGIVNASLQISAAIGIAVLGTIAASRTRALETGGDGALSALTGGYHLAWTLGALTVAAGAAVTLAFLRPPKPPTALEEPVHLRPRASEAIEAEAA
jgi:predicted MFS family arabinose efflux permease